MTSRSELLSTARDALAALSPAPVGGMTDEELCMHVAEVEELGRLVDSLRVHGAGEVDHRSRRSLGTEGLAYRNGDRRSVHLVERITRTSQAEAARRIRIARDLRPDTALDGTSLPPRFPLVTAAVDRGELGVDAALAITKNLSDAADVASVEAISTAERKLVTAAKVDCADLVAVMATVWRSALDPDGTLPREERMHAKRRFSIGRENVDGLTPFSGLGEPVFIATLRSAIGERTSPARVPRFLDPADADLPACDDSPFADDPRTNEQRAYDVLEGLLTAGIRADAEHTGPLHSTASVNITVRASDLANETGPAWLDDVREPISAALAAALACDAGSYVIGLDHHGNPLWMSRRERYFTAAQRKALAVRDGGCVFPGCTAPPSWCHAHHVVEWTRDGPTDIDNGVLLCAFHHRVIHRSEYRLRMIRGRPHLLRPRWIDREQQWIPVGKAKWAMAA
jgi:hypothetical protein